VHHKTRTSIAGCDRLREANLLSELIHITVQLHGRLAEVAGEPQLEYALVPPVRVGTVLDLIGIRRPQLTELLAACEMTVNEQAAGPDTALSDGDKLGIHARD